MDAHHGGSSGHGLEPRQARGDGRRVAPELDGDRRIHRPDRVDGEAELAMRIPAPGLQLVVGGLAGSEIRGIGRRRRERGVKPRHQRPEVLRDVRRPVHRHASRRRDEAGEELRRPLRDVVGAGDVRLEHRQRGDAAVAGHGLRPAGETWNTGEPCLLGEIGGQLQVRVEARLDASVRLEQHAVADRRRSRPRRRGRAASRPRTRPRRPPPARRPRTRATAGRPAPRPPVRCSCPEPSTCRPGSSPGSCGRPRSQQPAPARRRHHRPPRARRRPGARRGSRTGRSARRARPVSTSTRASATSGARAKAWARRADAGAPTPGAYHRRAPRSARSRSRTAPRTAATSSGPGWGLTGSITGAPCARAVGRCR